MKVLVTGGAGFIGSNYVRRVVDGSLKGVSSITVLDKLTYAGTLTNLQKLPKDSYEFIQGDICDPDFVNKIMPEFDAVINFAAESHVDRSIAGSREFVTTNVLGVQNLLDAAKNAGTQRFVHISTDEVYGTIPEGSWPETDPLLPNSPYAASKAAADLLVRSYHRTHGLDVRVTRCSNNYGPYQFPEKVIPLFVTNLIEGKKVPVYGSGLNVRDWLHVDDHCRGIHAVLTKGTAGEIYNIGGGLELTNLELTQKILQAFGKGSESVEYVKDRKAHDLRYSVDWSKINRELGYEPQVKFEVGLSKTIQWYLDNEEWWKPLKNR
jgi:dTDP-glucose 4,6-dehydratase